MRGVSLLEVILAFTIFVSVMVLMMSVWVTHARSLDMSQNQEAGGALCQMLMEQTLNQGYLAKSVAPTQLYVHRTLRGVTEDSVFTSEVAVSYPSAPLTTAPCHKVVVVNVTWLDSSGNHTISMESNAPW